MRMPIALRVASVNSQHIGHREGDTVIGAAHRQKIVTLVERKKRDDLVGHGTI